MNQEDINRMAVEAWGEGHEIFYCNDDGIEKFAKLIAEECAKVCENLEIPKTIYGAHPDYLTGKHMAVSQCAAAIREMMK